VGIWSWFRRRQSQGRSFEAGWNVALDAHAIVVKPPKRPAQSDSLADLRGVIIETNDTGPWGADVWWLLFGADDRVAASSPQGATGEKAVIYYLMALPGFDFEAMGRAMRSTNNAVFPVWRPEPG
jgi:hypothetical protein